MKAYNVKAVLESKSVPYEFYGNENAEIGYFSSIYDYKPGTVSWIRDRETMEKHGVSDHGYTCLIIPREMKGAIEAEAAFVVGVDPKEAFFLVLDAFWAPPEILGIAPTAIIEEGARIGKNVRIGHHCVISRDSVIGDNCVLEANVVLIGKVTIGQDSYIGPGVNIGGEGFGFNKTSDEVRHYRHYGGVTIGRGVFIGANCCIARGALEDTLIDDYVKISNLCHIAHNVVIGKRTIIVAGTTFMGSVRIGRDCWISTAVVRDQVTIGDGAVVGMGAVVVKNVEENTTVAGVPAKPIVRHEKI